MMLLLSLACVAGPTPGETGLEQTSTCANPELRTSEGPFEEIDPGPDWANQPTGYGPFGGGLAVADWTGDEMPDIFLPGPGQDSLFVAQSDGTWADETATRLPGDSGTGDSATTADYDGDGDLDLYVGDRGPNRLLRNDHGIFTEIEAGVSGESRYTTGAAFGDIDHDGDLDLLVVNHEIDGIDIDAAQAGTMHSGDGNLLFMNDGNGGFDDRSSLLLGGAADGYSFSGTLLDLNGEVGAELYVVNDFGAYYAKNTALSWTGDSLDFTTDLGLDAAMFGMGLGVGDLDGDGIPSLFVPGWDQLVLLERQSDGNWYDTATARGLSPGNGQHVGWGGSFADLDNDADLDLAVAYGMLVMPDEERQKIEENWGLINPEGQPDALFVQASDGSFEEQAAAWGIADPGENRGTAVVDLNGDGWLDLVKRDLFGPAKVYRARCGTGGWLSVNLADQAPNRFAIGARIQVEADGKVQTREVFAGGTDLSTGVAPAVHFGLGDAAIVDRVTVRWPDGEESIYEDVEPSSELVVVR